MNKYYCRHCGKTLARNSKKAWIKSFCVSTGKAVRITRMSKAFEQMMSGLDDVENHFRAGSTVCAHLNEPFDCPQCRNLVKLTTS